MDPQRARHAQIVFACLDGDDCDEASSKAFTYTGLFEPATDFAGATFAMGPAPTGFSGIDFCSKFTNPAGSDTNDAAAACGHITLGPTPVRRPRTHARIFYAFSAGLLT